MGTLALRHYLFIVAVLSYVIELLDIWNNAQHNKIVTIALAYIHGCLFSARVRGRTLDGYSLKARKAN